jgi:hypothetical protein
MARLTPAAGTLPMLAGITAATVLSGVAVFTVVRSGCDDPGRYESRDGVMQLIGGCVAERDLPVVPEPRGEFEPRPLGKHVPADPRLSS